MYEIINYIIKPWPQAMYSVTALSDGRYEIMVGFRFRSCISPQIYLQVMTARLPWAHAVNIGYGTIGDMCYGDIIYIYED